MRTVITRPDMLKENAKWAILIPQSTTVPGDERSRTAPGHGYPEHVVKGWEVSTYEDQETWEKEIIELTKKKAVFLPLKIDRPFVATKTTFSVQFNSD